MSRSAAAAADYFQRAYGLPTALVLIDTYSVAAGFTASGDDNDTTATQRAFGTLRFVHKHTGAVVLVVDHFGKMVESGTRGSSNKEGNADTVLAMLADRELSGTITNTRLAVRKQRDGMSGLRDTVYAPGDRHGARRGRRPRHGGRARLGQRRAERPVLLAARTRTWKRSATPWQRRSTRRAFRSSQPLAARRLRVVTAKTYRRRSWPSGQPGAGPPPMLGARPTIGF